MPIGHLHASHIRKVSVRFHLEAPGLDPQAVSNATGLEPTLFASQGDERLTATGDAIGIHEQGWWQLSTEGVVSSKDINDHLRHLLGLLAPYSQLILGFSSEGETYFDVLWQSTYLYAGTGPVLDAECVSGMAALGAGIGFDIYQIDEQPA